MTDCKVNVDFPAFLDSLDAVVSPESDPRTTALSVRNAMTEALRSERFRIECVEKILDDMDPLHGRSRFPMIHRDRQKAYSVCVFHWPAGQTAPPHLHDYWTVTGVLFNALRFRTFSGFPENPGMGCHDAGAEKIIDASAGDVGYICTSCIHDVVNISGSASLSLHVFNHPAGAGGRLDAGEAPRAGKPVPAAAGRGETPYQEAVLSACAGMLGLMRTAEAAETIKRIYAAGGTIAGLSAVRALCPMDPQEAARLALDLSARIGGQLGESLRLNSERILST